ncbi:MAG: (2Fe-2S)-binding protein [Planctomycetaceae bacterium]|nr:(2Fe-2S)-binding protein [Planctomycetaceae bacterium]
MHSIVSKTVALVLLVVPLTSLGVLGFVFLASPPPLRPSARWLSVAPTSQIPANGQPTFLPIMAPRYDAWTRLSDQIVGHVFVRRDLATNDIKVVSAVHGPLAVPVDYDQQAGCFISRCFGVRFDINGTAITDRNVIPSHAADMPAVDFTIVDDVLFVKNTHS